MYLPRQENRIHHPLTHQYIYGVNQRSRSQNKLFITRDIKTKTVKKSIAGKKANDSKKSAIKLFLSFTTLPGFSQFGRQTHTLGRIFWLFGFIGGLSLGIYQSWGLINDYFEYKTYQQTVTHVNSTLAWPAITVCGKSPLRWKDAIENANDFINVSGTLETKYKEVVEKYNLNFSKVEERYAKEHILLSILRGLWTIGMEDTVSTKLENFVLVCLWNYVEKCNFTTDFIQYYNTYFGTCYTFNSGLLPGVEEIKVEPGKALTMAVYVDLDQEVPFIARNNGIVVMIHEPGTAAIINQAYTIHLQAGEWVNFKLKVASYQRLPAPYPSKCVDQGNVDLQKASIYYEEETPYRYSFQACMASCMQTSTYKNCDCINQKIPWTKDPDVSLCTFKDDCAANYSKYSPDRCYCPFTCKEYVFTHELNKETDLIKYDYWMLAATELFQPVLKYLPPGTVINRDLLSSRIVVFDMYFGSVLYDETVEFAKYTIADFWGAVGGNIGFWTGISVLSLVEFIELLYLVIGGKN